MLEKLKKATVAALGEENTQTLVLLFSAVQSGFCLEFSTAIAPTKVNSDLAVKSSGYVSFFVLVGLFPTLTTPSNMKLLPWFQNATTHYPSTSP